MQMDQPQPRFGYRGYTFPMLTSAVLFYVPLPILWVAGGIVFHPVRLSVRVCVRTCICACLAEVFSDRLAINFRFYLVN